MRHSNRSTLEIERPDELEELRNELSDVLSPECVLSDDWWLLRFLNARKKNTKAAAKMVRESLKWREQWGIHTERGLQEFMDQGKAKWADFDENWPSGWHSNDKRGIPIFYERLGKVDFDALFMAYTEDELIEYHIWKVEQITSKMYVYSVGEEFHYSRYIIIEDVGGVESRFYMDQRVQSFLKRMAAIDEANYPESIQKFYVVNCPWIFRAVWTLVKSFLDEVTRSKIVPIGNARRLASIAQSDNLIDSSSVPKSYGGSCTCHECGDA